MSRPKGRITSEQPSREAVAKLASVQAARSAVDLFAKLVD
jgi:hypothetical protein